MPLVKECRKLLPIILVVDATEDIRKFESNIKRLLFEIEHMKYLNLKCDVVISLIKANEKDDVNYISIDDTKEYFDIWKSTEVIKDTLDDYNRVFDLLSEQLSDIPKLFSSAETIIGRPIVLFFASEKFEKIIRKQNTVLKKDNYVYRESKKVVLLANGYIDYEVKLFNEDNMLISKNNLDIKELINFQELEIIRNGRMPNKR